MGQAGRPLTPEQNEKITKWVVQKRIKQMMGICKSFLGLRKRVRLARASIRWKYIGRVTAMIGFSLVRNLTKSRKIILERKRTAGAIMLQSYFRCTYNQFIYNQQIRGIKKASKEIWLSYRRWNERKLLKSWLENKVEETRKRKEEELKEKLAEEQRKKIEELRLEQSKKKLIEEEELRKKLREESDKRRLEEQEKLKLSEEKEKEMAKQKQNDKSLEIQEQKKLEELKEKENIKQLREVQTKKKCIIKRRK